MSEQELIKDICRSEIENGCYNVKIDGIAIYNYIRRDVRERVFAHYGYHGHMRSPDTSKKERFNTYIISFLQFFKIILTNRKCKNFICAFYRQELVNGIFVEKFTDPLIEYSNLKNDFIIFERGRKGKHVKPRLHEKKIIYSEYIYILARLRLLFQGKSFLKNNQKEFDALFHALSKAFPNIKFNKPQLIKFLLVKLYESHYFGNILKKLEVKNLIAPSRGEFYYIIPAAKKRNITVFELQHGISQNETLTYSGYKDPFFTPDYFLAFGDMSKTDKYGVDIEKIKVIGFAFNDYLQLINKNDSTISSSDVLLVSDPNISDKMISVCLILAEAHPSIHFYYRAHPAEILTEVQKKKLLTLKNIHLDDNTVNLLVVLQRFTHVLGENSTAIYEALSMGKKVGKLYMEGLSPKDVDKDDSDYFWRIGDADSFKEFINASPEAKKQRKIYSKFDRNLFEDLISS